MIQFTADGKDYKLEVTAATLKQMQRAGVNFMEIDNRVDGAETLWKGLFNAHHASVSNAKRMELYRAMASVEEDAEPECDDDGTPVDALLVAIREEYFRAFKALERPKGNVTWKRT